jgi:hypothetical protein
MPKEYRTFKTLAAHFTPKTPRAAPHEHKKPSQKPRAGKLNHADRK